MIVVIKIISHSVKIINIVIFIVFIIFDVVVIIKVVLEIGNLLKVQGFLVFIRKIKKIVMIGYVARKVY